MRTGGLVDPEKVNKLIGEAKDCYIPKGELTCVTDLSTEEGVRKALESMKRKDGLYEEAKVHFDKGRFGNRYVGFIAYPKGKWVIFHDPDSSPVAFQIARGMDIYTLDVLRIEDKEGKTDSQIVSEIINTLYRGYREAGHPDSNLVRQRPDRADRDPHRLRVQRQHRSLLGSEPGEARFADQGGLHAPLGRAGEAPTLPGARATQIGRASCRERV